MTDLCRHGLDNYGPVTGNNETAVGYGGVMRDVASIDNDNDSGVGLLCSGWGKWGSN